MYIEKNNTIIYPDVFAYKTNQNEKECNKLSNNKDYTKDLMMVMPMQNKNQKRNSNKDTKIEVIISFPKEDNNIDVIKEDVNIILHNALHEYLKKIS